MHCTDEVIKLVQDIEIPYLCSNLLRSNMDIGLQVRNLTKKPTKIFVKMYSTSLNT